MARESTRGGRGWIYAILVAICLLLLFYVGNNVAKLQRPSNYRDPRTTVLSVSTIPKSLPRIATADIPLEIEPLDQILETTSWNEYRSVSAPSIALLEPPAGIKLLAPTAEPLDAARDPWSYGRNPTLLAENAASQIGVAATNVSVTQEIPTSSFRNTLPVELPISNSNRKTWPQSPQLRDSLSFTFQKAEEAGSDATRNWLNRVSDSLERLGTQELRSGESGRILAELRQLGREGVELSQSIAPDQPVLASTLARLCYSIERRGSIWQAIHECMANGASIATFRAHELDGDLLAQRIAQVEAIIQKTGDTSNWSQYLILSDIKKIANRVEMDRAEQVAIARDFLGRVMDGSTKKSHLTILRSPEVHQLADLLHPLTIGPVDYIRLLDEIETLEADPTHRCSQGLSEAIQCLRFSEHPEQAAISHAMAAHYRNANLRLAVSEEFINRLMPRQTHASKPVRQTILGAETRGASNVQTKLNVDFEPDDHAWKIGLKLSGDINSNTKSSRNGATFYNSSVASVQAVREIRIDTDGFTVNGQPATVQSSDALRKFSTEWDSLPILGDMVRSIAHQEFVESRPIAKRIMQSTIARETDREFDSQLNSKLRSTQKQLEQRLIGPLQGLQLYPMIMDLQSTDKRLIVRYRVASNHQTAAHTPRPIAPSDSLLSLQVHQSAFNNMVSQVVTSDREWTPQELADQVADILQQPRYEIAAEQAEEVRIRFHSANPITVEFEDGRLWLTLRIDSLEQPGRIQLKNFAIRSSYIPVVHGLKASLEREGVISVEGYKLSSRDRLPLRAIFNKVLSNEHAIPMVADSLIEDPRAVGLAVSQLEMKDGWLAIALSEATSPHVAHLQKENIK